MLSKIDGFLENCVTGFERQVVPIYLFGLPETVKQTLEEIGCQPPKAFDNLEKRVESLKELGKATYTAKNFILAGSVLSICAIAAIIFGALPFYALLLGIAGTALICGGLRLLSLYDTTNVDTDIKILQTDMGLSGEWLKQLNARKDQNDLSREQVEAVDIALSLGMGTLFRAGKSLS